MSKPRRMRLREVGKKLLFLSKCGFRGVENQLN